MCDPCVLQIRAVDPARRLPKLLSELFSTPLEKVDLRILLLGQSGRHLRRCESCPFGNVHAPGFIISRQWVLLRYLFPMRTFKNKATDINADAATSDDRIGLRWRARVVQD